MAKATVSDKQRIKQLEAQLKKANAKSVITAKTETPKVVLGKALECLPEAIANPDGFRPASFKFGRDSANGGMFLISTWKNGHMVNNAVRINNLADLLKNIQAVKHEAYIKE